MYMKKIIQAIIGILIAQVVLFVGLKITPVFGQTSTPVERQGLAVKMLFEQVNSSRFPDLKGKYKMRVGQSTFQPGGFLGKHLHSGPGIRYVKSGEIVSISSGQSKVYKAGETFYDGGTEVHELYNKTNQIAQVLNFEVLPSDWEGSSTTPIRK
jgi:quercetin dioxygenase-like cupin family protein